MKLGVFTTLLSNLSLEEALKYFKSLGIEMVEIGCGGYPGNAHANPEELLNDDAKLEEFKALLKKYDDIIKTSKQKAGVKNEKIYRNHPFGNGRTFRLHNC